VKLSGSTGDMNWHFDCYNATGNSLCMDSVEAEFA